jgi:hypothetical protein
MSWVSARTQFLVEHPYESDTALGKIELSKCSAILGVDPAAATRASAARGGVLTHLDNGDYPG